MNYPVIDIIETGIRVWEENVDGSLQQRVFRPLIRFLRKGGWKVGEDPAAKQYRALRPSRRLATKGELFASVSVSGRVVELEMWQELYNVENPHGGRYDSRKRDRMPRQLRRRCDLEMIRIVEFLAGLTGYLADDRRYLRDSSDDMIDRDIRDSWHYRPELGHADWHTNSNRTSADGGLIEHGQACWCRDYRGRILRGVAFYRLNNNWWVRLSRFSAISVWCGDIYLQCPNNPRRRRNEKRRAWRLNEELAKAVTAEDFQRAHLLKGLRDASKSKAEQAQKGTKAAA